MVCSYKQLKTARMILRNWVGVFLLLCNHTDCKSLCLSAFIQGLKDNPLSFCFAGSLYWNFSRDLLDNLPVEEPLIVALHPPFFLLSHYSSFTSLLQFQSPGCTSGSSIWHLQNKILVYVVCLQQWAQLAEVCFVGTLFVFWQCCSCCCVSGLSWQIWHSVHFFQKCWVYDSSSLLLFCVCFAVCCWDGEAIGYEWFFHFILFGTERWSWFGECYLFGELGRLSLPGNENVHVSSLV